MVLGVWAVGIMGLLIAGKYALFIRAGLWPLLLASLLILVCFLIAMAIKRAESGNYIRLTSWVRGLLLILPLFYLATLMSGSAASGLNSFALEKRSLDINGTSNLLLASANSTPIDNHNLITLAELYAHGKELMGKHVIVEGRVSKDDTTPAGQLVLYRFVVVCCAADAMPLDIAVTSPHAGNFQNDQWIRVSGKLTTSPTDPDHSPEIIADNIQPIAAPANPYLSPYSP